MCGVTFFKSLSVFQYKGQWLCKQIFDWTKARVEWDKFVSVEDHPVDTSDFDDSSLWNDMEADASSLRNTYQVDVDDAGVALTGVSE